MKNAILKTTGTLLAILMLATFAQISVSAQEEIITEENPDEQIEVEDASARRANTRKLEGVWNVQVTRLNCQTGAVIGTAPAMLTFMRGGTMNDFGTQLSPATRGPGYGVWSYQSGRRYVSVFQFFRFNADGTLAGRQIVRQQTELSRFGSTFTNTATAQVLDTGGNVIANNCSTAVGTRFE